MPIIPLYPQSCSEQLKGDSCSARPEVCMLRELFTSVFSHCHTTSKALQQWTVALSCKSTARRWGRKHDKGDWVQIYRVFTRALANARITSEAKTFQGWKALRLNPGFSRVLRWPCCLFWGNLNDSGRIYYQAGYFQFPFFTLHLRVI